MNSTATTFATRTAAIDYLVNVESKPRNYAMAAVDQSYNYEPNNCQLDLLYGNTESSEEFEPIIIGIPELLMAYNTMEEMFSVENNQILLDGEPMYTIEGVSLFLTTPAPSEADTAQFQANAAKTQFAIETSLGFWNREIGTFHPTVEGGSYFNWLEQGDHLTEAMEEIAATPGCWFKVICVTPFPK